MERRSGLRPGIGVGSATIVMVFAVLCLTIFAVLSLVTAGRELELSQRYADAVSNYYAADCLAAEIYDQLSAPDAEPEGVSGVFVTRLPEDCLAYAVPIDATQELRVLLRREGESLKILDWSVHSTGEWNPNESLKVWGGS